MARRLAWHLCFAVAFATPEVAFPFNSQVPPVARVGEPYTFTFPSTTFKPNGDGFQYSLSGAPAWLTLDSGSRTLSGTPGTGDVGTATSTITAADSTGSTPMDCTLVIVATSGPQLGESISGQLAQAGNRSGPTTLTCLPTMALNFAFSLSTFIWNGAGDLSYYATMSDHTPLPAWLSFDATQLHFAGTTPPLTTAPESFDILLIASDVVGFAGLWTGFTIVVSNHQLYFSTLDNTVNIEANQTCNIDNLPQLLLDGSPISTGDFAAASADLPSWLSFNSRSLAITGSAPSSNQQQDVNAIIVATDQYGDTANTTLHILFAPALPNSAAGSTNPSIWPPSAAISSTLAASSTRPRSSKANTSTSVPSSASTGAVSAASAKPASKKSGLIAGLTVIAISAVLVLAFWLWYCKTPRKHLKRTASALKRTISRPYINDRDDDDVWNADHEVSHIEDIEKAGEEFDRTPEHPPQIVIDFPLKSTKRKSSSSLFPGSPKKPGIKRVSEVSALNDEESAALDDTNRTSWGYGGIDKPHDSMKLANNLARSSHGRRNSRRYNSGSSAFFFRTSSIPTSRRFTGLGHGRISPGPARDILGVGMDTPRASSYVPEPMESYAASQSTPSTSLLTQSFPPPARSSKSGHRRSPSRSSTRTESRFGDASPVRRTHGGIQRPIPRRQAHRSTFFAAGAIGGASRSSRSSSSRARSTLLGLATIHGSPDIPSTDDHDHDATIVRPGEGSSPPPTAIIGPSGSDHLLQRTTPLSRAHTQNSARTWNTTTSGTSGSDIAPPPPFTLPPTGTGSGSTQDRLALAQQRFSQRLRARLAEGFPRPVSEAASSVNSSVIFADAGSGEDGAGSGSLYGQDVEGPAPLAGRAAERGDGGSIMERPRASYRLGAGSPERRNRTPLGLLGVGMGNRRVEKAGKGKEMRRLMGGKGKWPVSVEGSAAKGIGSLKGVVGGEKKERGDKAFL